MKKLLLYILRWQLSSVILYPIVLLFKENPLFSVVLANLLGALIFFNVDRFIFKK